MTDEKHVPIWSSIPALNSKAPKVVLMGDSVLDIFYWLDQPERHLRVVLSEMLAQEASEGKESKMFEGMECVNLAVDQMSTFDFEMRSPYRNPWMGYDRAKHRIFTGKDQLQDKHYYESKDGNIWSIENLKRLHNVHAVVVSIGGNDVYLNAGIQRELVKSALPFQSFRRYKVARQFGDRLDRILHSLRVAVPHAQIIPVIVYHPHYDFSLLGVQSDHSWSAYMATTLQKWYLSSLVGPMAQQTLRLAQEHKLNVIDLSRTFDPTNERHYGTGNRKSYNGIARWSGAEPSNVSNPFIARLIIDAMKQQVRTPGESTVLRGVVRGDDYVSTLVEQNKGRYPDKYVFGAR